MIKDNLQLPSNRSFGLFFSGVFCAIGLYFLYLGKLELSTIFLSLATLSLAISLIRPALLFPLNKAWMGLAYILGMIVSPLVIGLIYFVIITPVAVIIRLGGRDELALKKGDSNTYWKDRVVSRFDPSSFKNQF